MKNAENYRKKLGNDGELFVAQHVEKLGFRICAQNYRKFFGELDIVACKKQLYIFIEVKTRKSDSIALGQLISPLKQAKIIKTAKMFILENKVENATFRFDVALLHAQDSGYKIQYIENAFNEPDDHAY